MRPLSRHACGLLLAFMLAGCSPDEAPAPVVASALPGARVLTALDDERALILADLMDLIVDPAAGVLFAAADERAGTESEPRTPEAWQAVVDAAAQLSQIGEQLADPALARGRADWLEWSAAMQEGAALGSAAAGQHDARRLALAAVHLRASCLACHTRYAAQTSAPAALR